jgi:hypothetical protein
LDAVHAALEELIAQVPNMARNAVHKIVALLQRLAHNCGIISIQKKEFHTPTGGEESPRDALGLIKIAFDLIPESIRKSLTICL